MNKDRIVFAKLVQFLDPNHFNYWYVSIMVNDSVIFTESLILTPEIKTLKKLKI